MFFINFSTCSHFILSIFFFRDCKANDKRYNDRIMIDAFWSTFCKEKNQKFVCVSFFFWFSFKLVVAFKRLLLRHIFLYHFVYVLYFHSFFLQALSVCCSFLVFVWWIRCGFKIWRSFHFEWHLLTMKIWWEIGTDKNHYN